MANELKIVIDADVQRAETEIKSFGKVVNGEFSNIIKSANSLSKSLNASFEKIKSTSGFGVLSFDTSKALASVQDFKSELSSLAIKPITIPVDTSDSLAKIAVLEKEILSLEALKVSPEVTTTQIELFEANIQRLKKEINELRGKGVVVPINVNTAPAEKNVNQLSRTVEQLRSRIATVKSFIEVETDITKVVAYNKELENLEGQMKVVQNVGKKGFELFIVPNQTIQSVKNLTASVNAFGGGVKAFIPPAINSFSRFPGAIKPIVKSTNDASFALLNFGRVLQDAPFGILGIANNLNPLVESLGRASQAAKATGTSLTKNLLGALTGPAGIGLAISAVSSLLIVFGDKLFGASKALSTAEIEARKFSASIADIKTGIDSFFANLDFETNLDKLKNKLKFGDAAELFNIGLDKKSADAIVQDTNEEITKASNAIADIVNRRAFLLSESGQNLAEAFFSSLQTGVTVDTEGLSDADTKVFNILNENATKIKALTEQNTKARRKSAEADVLIEIQKADDLKKALDKQKDAFEKFQNDVIAKAQQFKKQFGDTFVLPELEVSFFTSKEQVFQNALTVINGVEKDLNKAAALSFLQIKIPVLVSTETKLNDSDLKAFLRGEITRDQIRESKVTIPIVTDFDIQVAESLAKEFEPTKDLIDNFFKSVQIEQEIPVNLIPDLSLSKANTDAIDKMLDLRKQFSVLGDLGLKEFEKIDFTNINAGIAEATKRLQGMMEIATTLNQAIGQGLVNAFNAAFDAVLEGKSVFKALAEAVKQLIVGVIKAIAQMLILKLITNAIFPGGGGVIGQVFGSGFAGGGFNQANFGSGGIGSRAFSNVLTVNVQGQISNDVIRLSNQRSNNSAGRYG